MSIEDGAQVRMRGTNFLFFFLGAHRSHNIQLILAAFNVLVFAFEVVLMSQPQFIKTDPRSYDSCTWKPDSCSSM